MSVNNSWRLEGNLVRDPEPGRGSVAIAKFTVAVDKYDYKTKTRGSDYFPCTAFGQKAEFILKYFKKGSAIAVIGYADTNKWNDRTTGEEKSRVEMHVEDAGFPAKSSGSPAYGGAHKPAPGATEYDEGNDPFAEPSLL